MTVQWYGADEQASVFNRHGLILCKLIDAHNTTEADSALRQLGWKRREAWQGTEWGFEARLRRRNK